MSDHRSLYEHIVHAKETLKNFQPEIFTIPEYITDNLKYDLFEWQKEALENFLFYEHPKSEYKEYPTHLMFNMATGTGKTLLMAALILYYYKQGYRHFLFFVNQNNIVDKTENNFLDTQHLKYLFQDPIVIDNQTVFIDKVETFSDYPQGIEIKFTTVQKFYNDIHQEKENQNTLEDLQKKDLVLLGDEAHHLNTNTKNISVQESLFEQELKGGAAEKEKKGWEHTVIEYVLKKFDPYKRAYPQENTNVLLEFTATIPKDKQIAEKYQDKIVYTFDLKEFLQAGYTKEINLISSSLDKRKRILQALLFQWYRHKIALKYNIPNFKPVVLFRSKYADQEQEENSFADKEYFLDLVHNLSGEDLEFLTSVSKQISQGQNLFEQGRSRTQRVLKFIEENEISFGEIADWIRQHYQERNIIVTNSQTKKSEETDAETEQLLNNLEDPNNHIRAIFTVKRLTEGWDVLNLFDIVRLYEGRDEGMDKSGKRKAGDSTIAERQLIGRGVRYYPFEYQDKSARKRKFDQNLDHELRVLEELYFYSSDDHRYISELKQELKRSGYIEDTKVVKQFDLKPEFKNSNFYKNTTLWYNKQIDNPNRRKQTLEDIHTDNFGPYPILGLEFLEEELDFDKKEDVQKAQVRQDTHYITISFKDIEHHIVQKAMHIKSMQEQSLLRFDNLQKELAIESIDELQSDKLANFELKILANKSMTYEDINNEDKLQIVLRFLEEVMYKLKEYSAPKKGSEFIAGSFDQFFKEPKTKTVEEDNTNKEWDEYLKNAHWYVLDSFYGTGEEVALIEFIKNTVENLENNYQEVYLLRNEELYKIYDFEKGRGFQPDFLLFLKTRDKYSVGVAQTEMYYQVFIEPKGDEFVGNDGTFTSGKEGWKQQFLQEITQKYGFEDVITSENPQYRLIGLPFYNEKRSSDFEEQFNTLLE